MADIRYRPDKNKPYQVRFPDPNTSSGFGYRSFRRSKEAKQFAAECELGGNSSSPGTENISVKKAVDTWLTICEKVGRDGRETVEPQTLIEYQRRANVICEYPWKKSIQDILPRDVIEFRAWLVENKSRDLARRSLSSFHSVLLEMKLQGYIQTDPAVGITVKTSSRYETSEVQIPSDEEMRRIFSAVDRLASSHHSQIRSAWQKFKPMIYLAAFSGMRPSEYRGLLWKNIEGQIVNVTQRADKTGLIGNVKSKAANRSIIIPSLVSMLLEEWREHTKGKPEDLVFKTTHDKPILLNNIFIGAWIPLMKEAGLMEEVISEAGNLEKPKYSIYSLRHYFASKLIESGQDFKYIQKVMGHSKIEITFNHYGHLIKGNEDIHKAAANELAASILFDCGQSVAQAS